jgi:hypothetical protein
MVSIFVSRHRTNLIVDALSEMIPALDNFIDFGKETIAARPDYRAIVLDFCLTGLTSSQLGDTDRVDACAIGESILLNLRKVVDNVSPM